MKAGGAGLARGFVSKYKDEFKIDGKVSFAATRDAYRYESSLPHSEKLESIRDESKQAIASYREQFQQHGGHASGALSSFGRFRTKRPAVTEQSKRQAQMLLDDYQQRMNREPSGLTAADCHQIVKRHDAVQDALDLLQTNA